MIFIHGYKIKKIFNDDCGVSVLNSKRQALSPELLYVQTILYQKKYSSVNVILRLF